MPNKFSLHSMKSFKLNAIIAYSFKATLGVNQHSLNGVQGITLTRLMSMWPTGFQDPITHKRDFPEMKDSGEFEKKALAPIKSAPNWATCSLFKDPLIQKFQRLFTQHGRSEQAENNLRETFRLIKQVQLKKYYRATASKRDGSQSEINNENIDITTDPTQLVKKAIENARPLMKIEKVFVGGIEYSIPAPITLSRSEFEGMKWIINAARDREKRKSLFCEKLAEVLIETASMTGRVINTKNEHHKTCEVNRAYAHFRRSR